MISFADNLPVGLESQPQIIGEICDTLRQRYNTPRMIDVTLAYIQQNIPAGRILVHGGGLHTRQILPALEKRSDIEVVGIIDQSGRCLWDEVLPVYTPGQVREIEVDYVLLSHTDREQEMAADLLANGFNEAKIISFYTDNPLYQKLALDKFDRSAFRDISGGADLAVITTGREGARLLSAERIAGLSSNGSLIELYMGRDYESTPGVWFNKIELHQSLKLLGEALSSLNVRTVLVQSTSQRPMPELPVWLKTEFPDITLIYECYDLACFIEDRRLKTHWGFNNASIRRCRLAELYAMRHADLVLHKNSGALWDAFLHERQARFHQQCLPGRSGADDFVQKPPGKPYRIVYPGGLYPQGHTMREFCDALLDGLCAVTQAAGMEADVYNVVHEEGDDSLFAHYETRLAQSSVCYHRRVTHEELMQHLKGAHFGWMYVDVPRQDVEYLWRICVPNKVLDFVRAGLVVIISSQYEAAARLLDEAGAGIVVEPDDPIGLVQKVAECDYRALRKNVERLAQSLYAQEVQLDLKLKALLERQEKGRHRR